MAAYRTAARLFPGLHQPYLGMGMEYQRMSNLHLAEHMFNQAYAVCPTDPLVSHELGVLAYKNGQHATAVKWFKDALQMLPEQQLTAGGARGGEGERGGAVARGRRHAASLAAQWERHYALYASAMGLPAWHGDGRRARGASGRTAPAALQT
jgi:tetratricopeptide (TPR) repeat protein